MQLTGLKFRKFGGVFLLILGGAQSVFAQAGRIPPRYVDEWYDKRFLPVLLAGAALGLIVSLLWLPRLLPTPHKDDNQRARVHTFVAVVLSLLLVAVALLVDIYAVAQFGRQSYEFKELFSDVFISRQTFVMLGMAALAFIAVVLLWTRFISEKFYRYMIIPR